MKQLTKTCVSAKPDTLQVYSFNGAGGVSDQLPMKQKKGVKGVSYYPFLFHEKKITKPKFGSAYSEKTQLAISGTNQTVTTADSRFLHRKNMSKPISENAQEPNNRGTGPRFTKSPRTFNIHDPDSESEDTEPESPVAVTPKKSGTLGRRPLKLVRNRLSSASPWGSPQTVQSQATFGPVTIVTEKENVTTEAVDRAIEHAREADTEIHLKDRNGKVSHNITKTPKRGEEEEDELENSELELLSNLSSSAEIEQETKEHNLRRSKRLTKTNPIIRLNNPVPSDYRNYRQKTQPRSEPNQRVKISKQHGCQEELHNDRTIPNDATGETLATQSLGRPTAHKQNSNPQLDNNYPIMEGK